MNLYKCVAAVIILLLGVLELTGQSHTDLILSGERNYNVIKGTIEDRFQRDEISQREYKHFVRWAGEAEDHLNEEGELFNYPVHNWKALQKFLRANGGNDTSRITNGLWESVSPSEFNHSVELNGRVNAIAIDPSNSNRIYAGTVLGGLWRTSNGGGTWQSLTDGFVNLSITSIVIDHINPERIFVLTGDGDGVKTPTSGVYLSRNSGISWEPTNFIFDKEDLAYGHDMIMHPTDPSIMYVATNTGVFRTEDNWQTWDCSFEESGVFDIDFVPGGPDTLYAAAKHRLWKSTDEGVNWTDLNDGGAGLPSTSQQWRRVEVALSPDFPHVSYVIFARNHSNGQGYYELYASSDHGSTYTLKSADSSIVSNQCVYNLNLAVEPSAPLTIFLGTVRLWKSTDAGVSFTNIGGEGETSQMHPDVHALVYDGNTLYVGNDGGVTRTGNGGGVFNNITEGMVTTQYYAFDVQGSRIMGGSQDNGTTSWEEGDAAGEFTLGGDGMDCMFHPTDPDLFYVSSQESRHRWNESSGMMENITPPGHQGSWEARWLMHPSRPDTMYCANRDIARSFDGGDTWPTFVDPGFTASDRTINCMVQCESAPDYMYISNGRQIKRTSNINAPSVNWVDVTNNVPSGDSYVISSITMDPDLTSRLWVCLSGYNSTHKVYYSADWGGTWQNITGNLPNVPMQAIAYEPGSNNGVYLGSDVGVFYRNDDMPEWEWEFFSNGLPKTIAKDFQFENGHIYVATFGRGVWKSDLYTSCPDTYVLTDANDPSPVSSTGVQLYRASNLLTSERSILGGAGTDVTYTAGDRVRLMPGFLVKQGNIFKAGIGDCLD